MLFNFSCSIFISWEATKQTSKEIEAIMCRRDRDLHKNIKKSSESQQSNDKTNETYSEPELFFFETEDILN